MEVNQFGACIRARGILNVVSFLYGILPCCSCFLGYHTWISVVLCSGCS